MKYLLDTNVCIMLLKGKSENIHKRILNIHNQDICIPAVVRYELIYGAYKSNQSKAVLTSLELFFSLFDSKSFDNSTAEICGQIRANLDKKGTPIGPYDLMIAATAISNGLILVTHNTKEFSRIEHLLLEDWEI